MSGAMAIRTVLMTAVLAMAGCVANDVTRSAAPVVNLDAEAALMLARIYPAEQLLQSLAQYQLEPAVIEREVLTSCSIAYSVVQRTQNDPVQRKKQLTEHHGSAYYIAEENRCAESLIANKVATQQWQRIETGQFTAGELLHVGRFDEALKRFNQWALQECPHDAAYVADVFQALDQRIRRQRDDVALLKQHYRDEKRFARVMSWHSGRRTEDYQSHYARAEALGGGCRVNAVPSYSGLSI